MGWEWAGIAAFITALVGVWKVFDERAVKKNAQSLAVINDKIDTLTQNVDKGQRADKLAITRLELMMLMSHDPDNVLEIERLARKYFVDMEGDSYMSKVYSDYAKKYKADHTFVTHVKE